MNIKSTVLVTISVVSLLGLSACANMNSTQQSTLSGASIGAVGGAVIGGLSGGDVGTGAAIGAGVGAVGGYLYEQNSGDYHYR